MTRLANPTTRRADFFMKARSPKLSSIRPRQQPRVNWEKLSERITDPDERCRLRMQTAVVQANQNIGRNHQF
jgi:hypothetical protein